MDRHSDHISEQVILEVLLQMRRLELHPPITTEDGSEFFAVHVQAHDTKRKSLCYYLVRFKVDEEVFIRTVHRDRNFRPKRIKDHEE